MTRHQDVLPRGTVTYLFTDIEGSTRLLERLGDAYADVLQRHREVVLGAVEAHNGIAVGHEGDALFIVFAKAVDAVAGALDAQVALVAEPWPEGAGVRVRMGMHTGESKVVGDNYVGMAVHIAARVAAAGHGEQILLTDVTWSLAANPSSLDLGMHRLKDVGEFRLRQLTSPGLSVDFPPLRTLSVHPNNLPASVDAFIGRHDELAEIGDALHQSRLVTLTGPGGSGKTRLALESASSRLAAYADGVWFVGLAAIGDASRVATAVANALRLQPDAADEVLDALVMLLRDRQVLLILDNCEHVVEAAAALCDRLLADCANVSILATSREFLGVRGENAIRTRPLAVDDRAASDAVSLFLDRAAASSTFEPGAADLDLVRGICRRLDGLPLAIELAAARLRSLSLSDLAARLDDRFRLLSGGPRSDLPRHRTLEAVVAWSYDLLSDAERALFRRLSVFPDHFTLAMAEAVVSDDELDAHDVFDLTTRLVEKSLVATVEVGGELRYRMLETLRQYGLDRMMDAGGIERWRDRLLEWASHGVAVVEEAMRTPAMDDALRAAQLDAVTYRASMDWAAARGRHADALRIASLIPVEQNKSERRREVVRRLDAARDEGALDATLEGFAWAAIGSLACDQGDWSASLEANRQASDCFARADLALHRAWAQYVSVHAAWGKGDVDHVDETVAEVLEYFRDACDEMGLGYALWVASLRNPDVVQAEAQAAEADRLLRNAHVPMGIAHNAEGRGIIALERGDLQLAATHIAEALRLFRDYGNVGCAAHALEAAAVALHRENRAAVASELLAAADLLRSRTGQGHRPWEIRARLGPIDALDDELPMTERVAAHAAGARHDLVSASALALEELDRLRP